MWPSLIAIGVAVAAYLFFKFRRHRNIPSAEVMSSLKDSVRALQCVAVEQLGRLAAGQSRGEVTLDEMQRNVAVVASTIRLIYTIDSEESGLLHTISSQRVSRVSEDYQVACMLIVLMTLQEQLKSAGIDPATAGFDISRSEFGTHYLSLLLTPDQHSALLGG